MNTVIICVVAICAVGLTLFFSLRKERGPKGELSPGAAAAVIVVTVLASATVLYAIVFRKPAPPADAGANGLAGEMGGGMGMAGGMGMGGGMGGGRPPSARRDLSRLVRQMAELQKTDNALLSAEQAKQLIPVLASLQKAEKMTDDEAQIQIEAIRGLLTEEQTQSLEKVELPQRGRGGGPRGGPAAGAAAPAGGEAATEQTREARMAAWRERMLEIPSVKTAYDAKLAEDPELATSTDKQRAFFREIRGELSPFRLGSSQEALTALLKALQTPGAGG